ncbi:MAG: 16S rRNA (cytosine(1402)-N(4))-methyltransferase RsmH [Stellaceae bacterium]
MSAPHIPVLLAEVVAALAPRDGAVYLDGTFGAGGASRALLDTAACRVVAFDRDPAAITAGGALAAGYRGRLTLIEGRFSEMETLLKPLGVDAVSGVALDLGVSSMQLDDAVRGFSFRADGPLDMRMSQHGESAADLVNRLSEAELVQIIRDFGEERFARRVARAILAVRKATPITRTNELAALVRRSVPTAGTIDAATRTFQAMRIAVNDELGELDRGLLAAERLLAPGGRLAVISFHSLEDRRVKSFLRTRAGQAPRGTRHLPATREREPSFRLLTPKPVTPSATEIVLNPRARSARLRTAERTAAPAWGEAA